MATFSAIYDLSLLNIAVDCKLPSKACIVSSRQLNKLSVITSTLNI